MGGWLAPEEADWEDCCEKTVSDDLLSPWKLSLPPLFAAGRLCCIDDEGNDELEDLGCAPASMFSSMLA